MANIAIASPEVDATAQKTKPEKPDQAKYEADLAAAQKEHAANMEKLVRLMFFSVTCFQTHHPGITVYAMRLD